MTTLPSSTAKFSSVIRHHLRHTLARSAYNASLADVARATALACRDLVCERMVTTEQRQTSAGSKRLYYLSMEFLLGRVLGNNLSSLGLLDEAKLAVESLGHPLSDVLEGEYDPALGNGGLGRLAACFMDSMATLGLPGFGYGIRYDSGLFRQEFRDGHQHERPENWFAELSPWLIARTEDSVMVPLYGRVEDGLDRDGRHNPMWLDWETIIGVPYDLPVVGHGGRTVNYVRLFAARSHTDFDMTDFNQGKHVRAMEQRVKKENVSRVLYPSDDNAAGHELRLIQEYFLVACSVRDIVRRHLTLDRTKTSTLPDEVAIQLNDTHPALAVAELMRVLIDEVGQPWGQAWQTTQSTCAYTNHTLLPEALEKWPVELIERVLPRHLQIIYQINHHLLDRVAERWPRDAEKRRSMSLVEESPRRQIRMAHLAIAGSHAVNGVSSMHSKLVRQNLAPDFHRLWPERFHNQTNGVTPRRWLLQANPELASLISSHIGNDWIVDLEQVRRLDKLCDDAGFQHSFRKAKQLNKLKLSKLIREQHGLSVDPTSLFDVQAKRIHEYKRQLLNAMHIIHQYLLATEDGVLPTTPRTYLFAGKAAPGYATAKLIIKLINEIANVVNQTRELREMIKVVFLPNYTVSTAERLIPAADLSEQISCAGTEASGTGNMKFAMNGAMTIGTLDGANVELREAVGADNFYLFGHSVSEARKLKQFGYDPWTQLGRSQALGRVIDAITSDRFCRDEPKLYHPLVDAIMAAGDQYLLLADFDDYVLVQSRISEDYADRRTWTRRAILNVTRSGFFSSDRAIRGYADEIWKLQSRPPKSNTPGQGNESRYQIFGHAEV